MGLALSASALVMGCPGGGTPPGSGEIGPPVPTDFTPPPPLGAEPPPPDDLVGRPWLEAVHERLFAGWSQGFLEQCRVYLPPSHVLNNMSLAATIELAVLPDGRLAEARVVAPSGTADFDAAALALVRDVAPYPAPPQDLLSDDGRLHVSWLFARDQRQAALAGARIEQKRYVASKAVPELLVAGRWDEAARRIAEAARSGDPTAVVGLAGDVAARVIELALVDSASGQMRADAALAAGRAQLKGLAPLLRSLATSGQDLALRRAALVALADLGDAEATPLFADVVGSLDGDHSVVAARAMARAGGRDAAWTLVVGKIADPDAAVRVAALATAVPIGSAQAVAPLAARLGDKAAPRPERVLAARALGEIARAAPAGGTPADGVIKALGAALADGDAQVRAAAAEAFSLAARGGYRSRGAFYKLQPLLKDRDPAVRARAVTAAFAVEPKLAAAEVPPLAGKERDREVLAALAQVLGQIPGPDALRRLTTLAQTSDEAVKRAALVALSTRPEVEARTKVGELGRAEDPELRVLAVRAAQDPGSAAAYLGDPALTVRSEALAAVVRLSGAGSALGAFLDLLLASTTAAERVRVAEVWLSAQARAPGTP